MIQYQHTQRGFISLISRHRVLPTVCSWMTHRNFFISVFRCGTSTKFRLLRELRVRGEVPVAKKSSASGRNDYWGLELTLTIMKHFLRLVTKHINTWLSNTLDPFQYAYRSNRSTGDAISDTIYPSLTSLDNNDNYARVLFIDFTSAFDTIIPQQWTETPAGFDQRPSADGSWMLRWTGQDWQQNHKTSKRHQTEHPVLPRAVCSVHCSLPCWLGTVLGNTVQITSLTLLRTQQQTTWRNKNVFKSAR